MKKIILLMVMPAMVGAIATVQKNYDGLTPGRPFTSGEFFQDVSRVISTGRVVLPHGLDVTSDKTVHPISPSAIRYVGLGSQNIVTGRAEDVENVLRARVSAKDLETETNMSVICEGGSFCAFNAEYADEPEKLSIGMKDFPSTTEDRLPSNRSDIYFKELGNEPPVLVKLMMQAIYQNDRHCTKHTDVQQFGIKFLLRGLYTHNDLLYFHTRMENDTDMPYSVDLITFKVVDKKMAKCTAIQGQMLQPLYAYYQMMQVHGMGIEHTVFVLEQFFLAEDKQLEVTLHERNGGRTLTFHVTAEDSQLAKKIDNLKLKWQTL